MNKFKKEIFKQVINEPCPREHKTKDSWFCQPDTEKCIDLTLKKVGEKIDKLIPCSCNGYKAVRVHELKQELGID